MKGYAALSVVIVVAVLASAAVHGQERWVHPKCEPLECTKNGPFIQSDDGGLTTVEKNVIRTSNDGGKTWSEPGPVIHSGVNIGHVGHVGQLLRTRDGALVVLYLDFDKYKFSWDNEKGAPNPDCILELWAIRSIDDGKTWVDRQQLLPGYNADFMGFIQTSKGDLVVTCEHLVPELRRWISCSFVSGDDGETWKQSNWIDLGGHGHHDGAVEPMVTELSDGRLMMLIRTSLGEFWKAYSNDGGRYWRTIEPSGIDASSAPGWLLRLESGRLVLAWNRKDSEAKGEWPKTNSAGPSFEFPCSVQREELSIAFSEDDGDTWTEPVVIAREPGGQLSYPYILERTPGEIWVFTRYTWLPGGKAASPLAVRLREVDFVAAAKTIDIGSRLELMVDEYLVESRQDVELRLHRPTPREIAIVHNEPWEGNASGYHTVLRDDDVYRMYYRGHRFSMEAGKFGPAQHEVVCYAESTDGIEWTKPNLGLVAFNGSAGNNIIWDGPGTHNFTPFKDTNPDCPPDAKYKALGGITDGLYIFKSTDGIHWSQMAEGPVITEGAFDSQNVGFWDKTRARYAAYFRTFTDVGGKRIRSIAMTTSPDFANWSPPVPLTYPGAPPEQLYTNQVIPYYRAPHILLGFPTRYVDRPLTEHIKTVHPIDLRDVVLKAIQRGGTDLTDGVFMTSRDGVTFHRCGEAFLRPGMQQKGNWMYGNMYQNWGIVETQWDAGDGNLLDLAGLDVPNELSIYVSEGAWLNEVNRMRRYTFRIDGFVSMHAPLRGGEFVTKPIRFKGEKLVINYSTSAAGSVRVELQDAGGTPIEGYSLNDCPEIYGDTVDQTVHWKSGPDVSSLAGKPIRLRFVLKDADLYSLQLRGHNT